MKIIRRGLTSVGPILTITNLLLLVGIIVFLGWCFQTANSALEDAGGFSGGPVPGDLYYRAPTLITPPTSPYPTLDESFAICRQVCTTLEATKLHWHGNPRICECYYEFKGVWAWRIVWMDRTEVDYNDSINP